MRPGDVLPQPAHFAARSLGPATDQSLHQQAAEDAARGYTAHGADLQSILQQPVEDAPGERAVRAASLEGNGDARLQRSRFCHRRKMARSRTQDNGRRRRAGVRPCNGTPGHPAIDSKIALHSNA